MREFDMPIRNVAKAVLIDEETGRYLTLRTPRGIFNIPGGGIDEGEDPRVALQRELGEELPGFRVIGLSELAIGCVAGGIIHNRWARWQVFTGVVIIPETLRPGECGQIPKENSSFNLLEFEEVCRAESTGSMLASRAICLAHAVADREVNGLRLLSPAQGGHQRPTE